MEEEECDLLVILSSMDLVQMLLKIGVPSIRLINIIDGTTGHVSFVIGAIFFPAL